MSDVEQVREALARYGQMTVAELAATIGQSPRQVRRVLTREEVTKFARVTDQRFHSSIVVEFIEPPAKAKTEHVDLTEDDVLRIWEMHADEHRSLAQIGRAFHVTPYRVRAELEALGVLEPQPTRRDIDPADPLRGLDAEQAERYVNIMAALGKIGDGEPISTHSRHLRYANSLPHIKPGTRHRVPQSEHQRRMDRLGSGPWATVIRRDLRRSGLLS